MSLTAPQALSAIQALVTRAVAHGYMAAVGTGGGVLLKMRDRFAERLYLAAGNRHRRKAAMPVAPVRRGTIQNIRVFGDRQARDRPVYGFSYLAKQAGHGPLGLGAVWCVRLAITRN